MPLQTLLFSADGARVHVMGGRCDSVFAEAGHDVEPGSLIHLPPDHPRDGSRRAGSV